MASPDDWFYLVRRSVGGAPEQTMRDALVTAAREFCHKSWFVRRTVAITTVAGQDSYTMPGVSSDQEEIVAVRAAQAAANANSDVCPIGQPDFAGISPDLSPGAPRALLFMPYDLLVVRPVPNAAITFPVEVIVQPVVGAIALPDELAREYDQAVAYGAIAWMQGMANKAWSNPQQALVHRNLFLAELSRATALAIRNFSRGNARMRPSPFIV